MKRFLFVASLMILSSLAFSQSKMKTAVQEMRADTLRPNHYGPTWGIVVAFHDTVTLKILPTGTWADSLTTAKGLYVGGSIYTPGNIQGNYVTSTLDLVSERDVKIFGSSLYSTTLTGNFTSDKQLWLPDTTGRLLIAEDSLGWLATWEYVRLHGSGIDTTVFHGSPSMNTVGTLTSGAINWTGDITTTGDGYLQYLTLSDPDLTGSSLYFKNAATGKKLRLSGGVTSADINIALPSFAGTLIGTGNLIDITTTGTLDSGAINWNGDITTTGPIASSDSSVTARTNIIAQEGYVASGTNGGDAGEFRIYYGPTNYMSLDYVGGAIRNIQFAGYTGTTSTMMFVDSTRFHGSASMNTVGVLTAGSINWTGAIHTTGDMTLGTAGASSGLLKFGGATAGTATITAATDITDYTITLPGSLTGNAGTLLTTGNLSAITSVGTLTNNLTVNGGLIASVPTSGSGEIRVSRSSTSYYATLDFSTGASTNDWQIYTTNSATPTLNFYSTGLGGNAFELAYATGNGIFAGSVAATAIKLTTGAADGYFLKSDAAGNGTWVSMAASQVYKGTVDGDDGKYNGGGTALIDGTGTAGWYYRCIDAGTYDYGNPNGNSITLAIGDDIYYNGATWQKIPGQGYTLQTATASVLGGIKVGTSLQIASDILNINDKDMGDVTTSGSGSTWTIDAGVVTYAKMQNISAQYKVLGRTSAGAGVVEELAMTGTGSVAMSTSPTFTTPTLGAAIGTSLTLGGATLGSNALAVTGSGTLSGNLTVNGGLIASVPTSGSGEIRVSRSSTSYYATLDFSTGASTNDWQIYTTNSATPTLNFYSTGLGGNAFELAYATGNGKLTGSLGLGGTPGASTKLAVNGSGLFYGGSNDPGDGSPAGVRIYYDVGSDFGGIQSMQTGIAYKKLLLQPGGGSVLVGTTADHAGEILQVSGNVYGSGNITVDGTGTHTFGGTISVSTLTAAANLTASPVGDFVFNTGGKDIYPLTNYDQNLGTVTNKYKTIQAAELWIQTLVSENVMATQYGHILTMPSTPLVADVGTDSVYIQTKLDNLSINDRIVLIASGKYEQMTVTSAALTNGSTYRYSVTRNTDGTGKNVWYAGDAVASTGQTGSGHIDQYAVRGWLDEKTGVTTQYGPTIVGNVRTDTTYNAISPRWAIGNLNGLYGYSTDIYGSAFGVPTGNWIKVDPTNGVRIGNNTTTYMQLSGTTLSITGYTPYSDTANAAKHVNNNSTTIGAGKILISGATTLANWTASGHETYIDGGNIYTGTVTTTQLNFVPATSTNVIAKINASAEGIRIDADNISISGSTTFSSGYDPTTYTPNGGVSGNVTTIIGNTVTTSYLNAKAITVTGNIGAGSGTIGGWTVGASSLYNGRSGLTTGVGIYLGTNGIAIGATAGTPEFKVLANGQMTATSATITGAMTATSGSFSTASSGDRILLGTSGIGVSYQQWISSTATTYTQIAPNSLSLNTSLGQAIFGINGSGELEITTSGGIIKTGGRYMVVWRGSSASDPTSPIEGQMYYNTATTMMRVYTGGAWTNVTP